MINNIIFDWAGVINDCKHIFYLTMVEMFKKHDLTPITMEELQSVWVQPYMLFYNKYFPNISREEEAKMYRELYGQVTEKHPPKPYPGIVDLIKKAKEQDKKMIIISSDHPQFLLPEIEKFGLQGIFQEINGDIHDKAEDLPQTIKRNGFHPQETIFFGDSIHEVKAGKSVSVFTGAVTWGVSSRKKLAEAEPDYLVDTLADMQKIIFNS